MNAEDEAGMNRVLDTLQIPRNVTISTSSSSDRPQPMAETTQPVASPTGQRQPTVEASGNPPEQGRSQSQQPPYPVDPWSPFGLARGATDNQNFVHWGFTLPTAESLDTIYANINGGQGPPVNTGLSPDSFQLGMDMAQQPGVLLGQLPAENRDHESDSDEENEAESDVIEQLSHRIGTLKIAGDGHLRFYGATSNQIGRVHV